ncbi:invasion associated locus B family protein [Yoonia sp.]|uniref:invasion associated locus B family protein n=1 Tax=Yoonia sp. TaxID=2212373 RepID=UPI0019EA3231|nr:invasion associated locus B family protein [Yoonia sp.]MBE0414413.1 invasion associated locus B family protein [Yoonia sp.]
MRCALKSLFVATMLMQAPFAFAQEAESPSPADPIKELSLGEPAGPQVGDTYVAGTFGDWAKRCQKAPEGQQDPCNLYQLLTDENDAPVAEFSLFRLPDGARAIAGATIVAPLETLLTQQLTLTVDRNEARRYPFSFCNAGGCVARVGFTQTEVDQFKRGAAGTVRLVPAAAPDAEVVLTLSLAGFTAAYDALSARD